MSDTEYFLTEATEPIYVRRGDPLGFRPAADAFADLLAPGLSNRTYDARWLTILSWILVRVAEARAGLGLKDAELGLEQRREIYRWIRPLELMWVARAVRTFKDAPSELRGRQLPGQNAVRRDLKSGGSAPRRGLSNEQYERYRFVGPHGAYRGLLAGLDGFTAENDGYRPGRIAESLANALKDLPHVREPGRTRGRKPTPEDYWQEHWPGWRLRLGDLRIWLPSRWNTTPSLRADERNRIRPAMFERSDAAKRRRRVAELAATSSAASHRVLVAHVVAGLRSSLDRDERNVAALLPQFTAFADAGVDAMLAIWRPLRQSKRTQLSLTDVLVEEDCKTALEKLRQRASGWKQPASGNSVALFRPVGELAGKLRQRAYSGDMLRALLEHHIANGGGRRWFRLSGSHLSADTPTAGDNASPYRFRLWSLGRLAWQLGVTDRMPNALADEPDRGDVDEGTAK